jgi:glutamate-1-semialdehyde 2,1-aminomutase
LTNLAHEHGALVVADEVVTGFRFHYGTAQRLFGFEADLSALGKIIGGGLPVAAVVGRREILALADSRRKSVPEYVYFSGTLNGYALGAAAGLATLDVLRTPGSYERLNALGAAVREALQRRLEASGIRAAVVGRGPMFHVLFNPPPTLVRAADIARSDLAAGARFGAELIRRGLLVNPVQRSYISLAHTDDDVAQSDRVFGEAITSAFGG